MLAKFSRLAKMVDRVADQNGIAHKHIVDHPKLLEELGLEKEELDASLIHEARCYHLSEMNRITRGGLYTGANYDFIPESTSGILAL